MLDANALFWPFTHGTRITEEVERLFPAGARVLVAESGRAELDGLVQRGVRHARAARELAERYEVFPVPGRGDSGLLAAAAGSNTVVATADRALQARLRARGVAVLVPRDRARLELKLPSPEGPSRATVKPRAPLRRRPRAEA